MPVLAVFAGWLLGLVAVVYATRRLAQKRRAAERVFNSPVQLDSLAFDVEQQGLLSRWLYLAGYRGPRAAVGFVAATLLLACLGAASAALLYASGLVRQLTALLAAIPAHVGDLLLPLAYGSPWLVVLIFALLPTLVVRRARRKRVEQVEADLPLALDLLATLAQAGLGFDAAIDRVMASQPVDRPLVQELRTFQRDVLAGRPRIESLRRLGDRLDVPWFTIFIAAVVQAEQIGAGLADVLRTQADDLRQRRREQALAAAMATPVKLLLPLIVCFLPGVLVAAMGPTFFELFQFLDTFVQGIRNS